MRLIADINAGTIRPCTQFFDVVELYDARNKIVHGGSLGLTESQESQAARFIVHGCSGPCSGGLPSIPMLTSPS